MSGRNSRSPVRSGLIEERIPFIASGHGQPHVVVLLGANALFKPLHRVPRPQRYADQVARLLPSGCRFTILGYEEDPRAPATLDAIADDCAAVMRDLGGVPAALVGISFGGFVAQRLAVRHPELVRRLVLLVAAHRFSAAGRRLMERQFDALRTGDFEVLLRDNALLFRRPWYNMLMRLKLRRERGRLARAFKDPALILRAYEGIFSDDFDRNADVARAIAAPTLLIGGGADQYFDSACLRETARLIAGSRLSLFPRETHMLPIERSRAVRREIAAFLADGALPQAPSGAL